MAEGHNHDGIRLNAVGARCVRLSATLEVTEVPDLWPLVSFTFGLQAFRPGLGTSGRGSFHHGLRQVL